MSTYAIGDVQGCYTSLLDLLAAISFNNEQDTLWFTGDLVNRGPQSLETLRFIKSLGDKHRIVLGNHDLHLLAVVAEAHTGWDEDTLDSILTAPDRDALIQWLEQKPLFHYDDILKFALVHAGLAPMWNVATAKALSQEVQDVLTSSYKKAFLKNMYGNLPKLWDERLIGFDRLRCITNYFTRLRFCDAQGSLELENKGKIEKAPKNTMPWFNAPHRVNANTNIIFGHWAALNGETNTPHTFALDTGCVWGYQLTAMRLEDGKRFSVSFNPALATSTYLPLK